MSSYAMTLGDVIERLERLSPDLRCSPAFGEPGSWRGDYCCIAFAPRKEATVREMLSCAKAADGATFTGYKGGDFRMSRKTECYVADYGDYNGEEEDALSTDNFPWLADGKEAEVTRLRASFAAAEDKLADANKATLDMMNRHRDEVLALEAKLADAEKHADELAAHLTTALTICSDDLGYEWTHCGDDEPSRALLAAHAARRAARDGDQEGTR